MKIMEKIKCSLKEGKCKFTNPNCVKMKARNPKQANWENSKIIAFVKQMEMHL